MFWAVWWVFAASVDCVLFAFVLLIVDLVFSVFYCYCGWLCCSLLRCGLCYAAACSLGVGLRVFGLGFDWLFDFLLVG